MKKEPTYIELKDENRRLRERIAYLERMLFGSSRDRRTKPADTPEAEDQLIPGLLEEFEAALAESERKIADTKAQIAAEGERRRRQSAANPCKRGVYRYSGLEERWHTEIPEGIDCSEYDVIGRDVTRILHRVPETYWVECIERPIFRLKSERNASRARILQAPAPHAVIGGNHVGADVLAKIVTDKFVHHIPEYRQVKMLSEKGMNLPTSTVNGWVHATASRLYPLYESLCEDIRCSDYLQIDEVPWKIADRKDRCRNGYAWQFRDARPDSHGLFFYYYKGSRGGEIPRAQLLGFKGAIQTDGYKVYDYFEHQEVVTLLACMAHIRRKFVEAEKSCPSLARKGLEYIESLYTLEGNLRGRNATVEETARERKAYAIPIMDAMEKWMEAASLKTTPSDLLGKAIDYAYKLWPRMRNYALDGRYHIDNNDVERGQRPTVMGRKNFLFSHDDRGAEDNAVFYSLLGSCEALGVNPLQWLTDVLLKIRNDMEEEDIIKLLPYQYK